MRRRRMLAAAALLAVALAPINATRAGAIPGPVVPGGPAVTLVAAGDIVGCSTDGDEATATVVDRVVAADPTAIVATLGDNVYDSGSPSEFAGCYEPSWGRFRARTRPAPGNHDYKTSGALGYFNYFGALAGDPSKGWYSYDIGLWHFVVLNSNCSDVGGCGAGSPQVEWLRADLAASQAPCTVAYWHHPRFNSGHYGSRSEPAAFWDVLYQYGAELVLNGHEHLYERFAPQRPDANADPAFGVRQFTVGTGGRSLYQFGTVRPNSEARNAGTYGVLKLSLGTDGYGWQFLPAAGESFTDSGSGSCHGRPAPAPPAPGVGSLSAAAAAQPAGGYWLVASDGGVFSFGSATFHGAVPNPGADAVGMAATPSGDGYWVADDDGDVFPAGAAADFGSRPGEDNDVAAFAARPQGDGYWTATRSGAVDAFGAAPAQGGVSVLPPHRIVALSPTPSGEGYWLGATDGGVFSLGDAGFFGSLGGTRLNQPIVGMAATPSGGGYWLVAADGGIFAFGDARFYGSAGNLKLNSPVVGMAATPSGGGYWLVAADGGIFAFGDARFYGSAGGMQLNRPIVGMAAAPHPVIPHPVIPDPAVPDTGGIRFVNATTAVTAKGATSITMPVPSGYQAGDVLVAMLQSDYGIVDNTPPPGWTLVTYREEHLTDLTGYVFVKVAGPLEPAGYTWQGGALSTKTFIGGTMLAFRGVDWMNPIFAHAVNGETSNRTKMECPSANAPAGGMLICQYTHDDGVTSIDPPSGMTKASYFTLPSGGHKDDAHATAYELIPTAGASGPRVANIDSVGGGQNDLEIAVVLKPA